MNKMLPEKNNPQQSESGTYQINGICHPAGGDIQQKVTYRTTANGRNKAHHVCAEPVERFAEARRMPLIANANVPMKSSI